MNEEWRVLMNYFCQGFSLIALISGAVAFNNAGKWVKVSHRPFSKLTAISLLISSFISLLSFVCSLRWGTRGVTHFFQWDDDPTTYVLSGLIVIVGSASVFAFHYLLNEFVKEKIANIGRANVHAR